MKKSVLVALVIFVFGIISPLARAEDLATIAQEAGYAVTSDIAPKASIVVDAESGQILWGDNVDLQRDPASTTKTMVVYLTMKAIKAGDISLDTEVVATDTDQAIADIYELSNNKIQSGVTYTVAELLTMTLVPSSNVATLMLSHLIHDGDDASFIQLMNDTAQELGMTNTVFYNGTGAIVSAFQGYYAPEGYDPTAHNLTTVRDLATLAFHLVNEHPEVLAFTDDAIVTVKEGTVYEETFESYNHSLPDDPMGISGVDGIKTGSSPSAGYNSIVTAERNGSRIIAVVLGASQWGDPEGEYVRHYFVNALIEKIYNDYQRTLILSKGRHKIDGQTYELEQDFYAFAKKGEKKPKVQVVDGRLVLATGNDRLSVSSGVAITPVKGLFNLGQASQDKTQPSTPFGWLVRLLKWIAIFFMSLSLLLACLVLFAKVKSRLKRRQSHK